MSTFFIQNRLFFLSKTLCHSILNDSPFFKNVSTPYYKETLRLSYCYHYQFFIIFALVFDDNNRTNGQ